MSPQTASSVTGIATTAISSGTRASADAKTNTSTISAPTPARSVSFRKPGPPLSPSASLASSPAPVSRTSAPSTRAPAAARSARASVTSLISFPLGPPPSTAVAGGCTIANVVRPSSETYAGSDVEPKDAVRAPGTARARSCSSVRRSARTAGALAFVPGGSVTTATSGWVAPPESKRSTIRSFVTVLALSGIVKFSVSASVTCMAP